MKKLFPLIALGFRMIKSYRLSAKYGTGEGGFVYDKEVLESLNEIKWDEYSDKDRYILCISEKSMEMGNSDFLENAWEFGKLVFNE